MFEKLFNLFKKPEPKKQPKNWREAFEQTAGKEARRMHYELQQEALKLTGKPDYKSINFRLKRMEKLNIHWYQWVSLKTNKEKYPSHAIMDGVLVNIYEPPNPDKLAGKDGFCCHAGALKGCGCCMDVLMEFNDVTWPHKVYYNGKIQRMTKAQFKQIVDKNDEMWMIERNES